MNETQKQKIMAAYQSGNLKEATRLLEKQIRKKSNDPEACTMLGSLYVDQELFIKAIPLLRRVLNSQPNNVVAKGNLAIALQNTNQATEAIKLLEALSCSTPDDPNVWFNLALGYKTAKEDDRAIDCYQRVLEIDPKHTGALINLSKLYKDNNFFNDSKKLLQQAININPTNPAVYFNLADLYLKFGHYNLAIDNYKKTMAYGMTNEQVYINIGKAYEALRQYDEAQNAYKKIANLAGKQAVSYREQGVLQKTLGNFTEAIENLRKAMGHTESFATACFNLSELRDLQQQDIDTILSTLSKNIPVNDQVVLYYALAHYYNQNKEYESAFKYLTKGSELKRTSFNYSLKDDINEFDSIKAFFTEHTIKSMQSHTKSNITPIFILGMPRSGTSLTEQILASHPEVYGGGELGHIKNIIDEQFRSVSNEKAYPPQLKDTPAEVMTAMGEEYLSRLLQLSDNNKFITDKLPHNFLHIGFIKTIFPDARIIHCVRDPIDTCWSIYSQLFTGFHPYSYQLDELARYYQLYLDLMQHWKTTLPDQVYDLHYEQLINNPESQIRDLLLECGLDWDPACLEFHKNKRGVATASATQIRQPIYKSAVKRWMPYQDKLKPLTDILASNIQ